MPKRTNKGRKAKQHPRQRQKQRQMQGEGQGQPTRVAGGWRPWAFGAVVLGVLGAAFWLLKPEFFPTEPALAGNEEANVILVQADMAGIYPKTIRVKAGEPVTIRLRSLDNRFHRDGGGKHQFAIDELGVNIIAQPLSTAEATFTPTEPGEYEYYCDICCGGRANPTMVGKLIVEL